MDLTSNPNHPTSTALSNDARRAAENGPVREPFKLTIDDITKVVIQAKANELARNMRENETAAQWLDRLYPEGIPSTRRRPTYLERLRARFRDRLGEMFLAAANRLGVYNECD